MPVNNSDIAAVLGEIADLLDIEEANPFRIRAYRNAARTINELGPSIPAMVRQGEDLTALPGIGEDLAGKIKEIVATGSCQLLIRLQKALPPAITQLLRVKGIGPKRVRVLYRELAVQTVEQLRRAALDGRIRALPGFGARSEQVILEAARSFIGREHRFKLVEAARIGEPFVAYLRGLPGVERAIIAGSFRRMRETVGDLDVLVVARSAAPVMQGLVRYEDVRQSLASGASLARVEMRGGMQVDVRVVSPESFGAALVYFTGSKAHNIALRRLAQERGLKINEYGVFHGREWTAGETEESVYRSVGLSLVPPELREDRGEIEAARNHRLPVLIEFADLRGDLHTHTSDSDGRNTLHEMVTTAHARGFEYLAITDHSRRLAMAHGLDTVALEKQIDRIDRLNEQLEGFTVLKGIEVDILEDGSLDLPDSVLGKLDIVVAAVHSRFDLSRARQTERVLRAMDRPYFNLFAHPSGRLIGEREPYDIDMLRIIRAAKARGCHLELNAHPQRLDLLDTYCQMARAEGVLISINSDAHSVYEFDNLRYGVGQARRGWLERADVLNTRPLRELRRLLAGSGDFRPVATEEDGGHPVRVPAGYRRHAPHPAKPP